LRGNRRIDKRVNAFLDRPIEGDWPYLWIDATYVKSREAGWIVSKAVSNCGPPNLLLHGIIRSEGCPQLKPRVRIFVSSPGDVKAAREVAALTIERLGQDYARFFSIEPYLWEYEAMVASGHFQDSIEPPSAFDIVVLILWSRLGTLLPHKTSVREYRGIDGRNPITGTEWEFEEALQGSLQRGAPDLLVYRKRSPASVDLRDAERRDQQLEQLASLDRFWSKHFANQGVFIGGYSEFDAEVEFAAALESHLRKLIERRIVQQGSSVADQSAIVWMHAPYRGLESYDFDDAPIFFGQDEALSTAMMRLTANAETGVPFLLVLGASGSGKSSLVKAGIVPKLFVPRRVTAVSFMRRMVFRPSDALPGEDLFDALARRLTTADGPAGGLPELIGPGQKIPDLAAHFRGSTTDPAYPIGTALGNLTLASRRSGRMLEHETARLVLVVDQLEELFTSEQLAADRQRFVAVLVGLVRSGLVWIIATMRSDFWHRAVETPQLMQLAQGDGRLELLLPTPAQLSQMIRRPAAAAGVLFDVHPATDLPLNEMIAEEVAHEPGALPLLSYLLDQLYRCDVLEAHGNTLTFASYERLGRLEGAIATKAEAVLDGCSPEERSSLKSVLFSLVQMSAAEGDVERAVSRRVPLSTFPPGSAKRKLVDALLHPDARLLVSDAADRGNPTVRVAHEALITRWARAREFVQGNAEALKIRGRIEERYALWHGYQAAAVAATKGGRAPSLSTSLRAWRARLRHEPGLLVEYDLADGLRLAREHRSDTEPQLIDYIERSAADDRRMRSRSVRVLVAVASVVTVLAILAGAAGLIAMRKEHEAQLQTRLTLEAQARSLTEAARGRLKDGDVAGAQSIIIEVLTDRRAGDVLPQSAVTVFQDARAADRQIAVIYHGSTVESAEFSPDGRRIVTASYDNTARIWDAATGALLTVLHGHDARVAHAAFSPDGRRVVTASNDKTARIWDAATGQQLAVLSGHDEALTHAVFSADGLRVVTASDDTTARVWNAATGVQLAVLSGHTQYVGTAEFSSDGRRIVTASGDKTARIWNAASGAPLVLFSGHSDRLQAAAFSPDGRHIVTAAWDRTARIWDASSGAQLAVLSGHRALLNSVAYSPDGSQILTASNDNTLRIWNAATGAQSAVLAGHTEAVTSARFSPDGLRIVTSSFDKTARVWDSGAAAQLGVVSRHDDVAVAARFSADGRRIVTASFDGTSHVVDVATGRQLLALADPPREIFMADFSPDGRLIATAGEDDASLWDSVSGAKVAILSGHSGFVLAARFSTDGRRVVTASRDKTLRTWDAASGAPLVSFSGHTDFVVSAEFSADGRRIVSASSDKTARIWDAATGKQLGVLLGHDKRVASAAYSPDQTRIVTASFDKTARIWDAVTGAQLGVLAHDAFVLCAAFSPDGRRIVTASGDNTARIWDAATGTELAVLSGSGDSVRYAAFSPDGRHIVTASLDKTVRIWDAAIPTDLPGQIAWSRAAGIEPLSAVERMRFGLPRDDRVRLWTGDPGRCDVVAAASYDPDRLAPGVSQHALSPDLAVSACALDGVAPANRARFHFQLGRALVARHDWKAARKELELAVDGRYRAAKIDLADLLAQPAAGMFDPVRAVSLNVEAWGDGVPRAAFQLGNLYEHGLNGLPADAATASLWYKKGADAGEPYALAQLAARDEAAAVSEASIVKSRALLLNAFSDYAAAAERAHDEDWPEDDSRRDWRYHRATLARLLAREGMMPQVAAAYQQVRNNSTPQP
jgi:WD40 repeat protein